MTKFDETLVSIRGTTGYITLSPVPNVILISHVLMENNPISLHVLSRSSSSANCTSDGVIAPLSILFIFDKPLPGAVSIVREAC